MEGKGLVVSNNWGTPSCGATDVTQDLASNLKRARIFADAHPTGHRNEFLYPQTSAPVFLHPLESPLPPIPPPCPTAMVAAFLKSDSASYRPLFSAPRSLSARFLAIFGVISIIYFTRILLPDLSSLRLVPLDRVRSTCPPRSYAAGKWVPKPPPTNRTDFNDPSDAFEFLGFDGCASTREIYWHLAADTESLWDRFPGVASWRWQPPADCQVREFDSTALVKDLVEKGGWLLIGGECHFIWDVCTMLEEGFQFCPVPHFRRDRTSCPFAVVQQLA